MLDLDTDILKLKCISLTSFVLRYIDRVSRIIRTVRELGPLLRRIGTTLLQSKGYYLPNKVVPIA